MTTKKATATPDAAEKTARTPVETAAGPAILEKTFADFNVHPDIVASLTDEGIIHPFPIQAMTLEVALGGHDIIGQAKTGTGKTLGFGIPMIQRVISPKDEAFATLATAGKPQALAVAPTRELAVQGLRRPRKSRQGPRRTRRHDLRRTRVRAADLGAAARCRDRRRHAGPAPRPRQAGSPRSVLRQERRARRG